MLISMRALFTTTEMMLPKTPPTAAEASDDGVQALRATSCNLPTAMPGRPVARHKQGSQTSRCLMHKMQLLKAGRRRQPSLQLVQRGHLIKLGQTLWLKR